MGEQKALYAMIAFAGADNYGGFAGMVHQFAMTFTATKILPSGYRHREGRLGIRMLGA